MSLCTDSLESHGVFDQTDLVSLPIAFVEALDGRTGKGRTFETEINSLTGCTIFYFAFPAMFGFAGILTVAAQTWLLLFQIYITDGAGNPAGCQHGRRKFCSYFHSFILLNNPGIKDYRQPTFYLNFDLS
jgi:hypothetical protein